MSGAAPENFFSAKREAGLVAGPSDTELTFFWDHIYKTPNCWLWMGQVQSRGYGAAKCGGRSVLAHRLSWRIHKGKSPGYRLLCHHCDVPPCVNPDHLFVGTHAVNLDDAAAKGRMAKRLSESEVVEILRLVGEGHQIKPVASMFDVAPNSIHAILRGKCWKRVFAKAVEAGFSRDPVNPSSSPRVLPVTTDDLIQAMTKHVASRIRQRRVLLGLSQRQLGSAVGVTYQQFHRYEVGENRIGASELFFIARALNVPVEFFYQGFGQVVALKEVAA